MNTKRYVLASLAAFLVLFIVEGVLHGQLLSGWYEQTADVWRPQGEANMGLMTLSQALFAFIFGYIFLKGYENKGLAEGLRYGILIGVLMAPGKLMWYSVLPVPLMLAFGWIGGTIVELALAGAAFAAVYRKS